MDIGWSGWKEMVVQGKKNTRVIVGVCDSSGAEDNSGDSVG